MYLLLLLSIHSYLLVELKITAQILYALYVIVILCLIKLENRNKNKKKTKYNIGPAQIEIVRDWIRIAFYVIAKMKLSNSGNISRVSKTFNYIVRMKFQNDFMLNKHNSNSHNLFSFTRITHNINFSYRIYITYETRTLFNLVDAITIMQSLRLKSKYVVYSVI